MFTAAQLAAVQAAAAQQLAAYLDGVAAALALSTPTHS